MKTSRSTRIASVVSVLLLTVATVARAGGGGGNPIPQLVGTWNGHYTYLIAFGGPANFSQQGIIKIASQDSGGNLGGLFCYGPDPNSCYGLGGKVSSNGAVELLFGTGAGGSFRLKGSLSTVGCLDGSSGTVMAGTFQVHEASGTFTFNNCPLP